MKGCQVYNGEPTREWVSKENKSSPTVMNEALGITSLVDAHEDRDVMGSYVPNAFVQIVLPENKEGSDRVCMKIVGELVDYLIEIAPETYSKYVVMKKNKKDLYVVVLKAIYGMLEASLLWYDKLSQKLKDIGFVFNPYDACVCNCIVNKRQHTVMFHVDDILSSHVDEKVNDEFYELLDSTFGEFKKVTVSRGKKHTFLGMDLDFSEKGRLHLRQLKHVEDIISACPIKIQEDGTAPTPAGNNLLSRGESSLLNKEGREAFHTCVAKGIFISKRSLPDIQPTISVLSCWVREPTKQDLEKLVRLCKYLQSTKHLHCVLSINGLRIIKWYVDASYAVHKDFRSHSGLVAKFGQGSTISSSLKQKLNTRSSTEAELVCVYCEFMAMVLWTQNFMQAQVYGVFKHILYQDNMSAILLENNGRKSVGKCSRHLNVRYFLSPMW